MEAAECDLRIVEALALAGELDEAEKALGKLKSIPQDSADALYVGGLIAELQGYTDKAVEMYEDAHDKDPNHVSATFRLAYLYDLHGARTTPWSSTPSASTIRPCTPTP